MTYKKSDKQKNDEKKRREDVVQVLLSTDTCEKVKPGLFDACLGPGGKSKAQIIKKEMINKLWSECEEYSMYSNSQKMKISKLFDIEIPLSIEKCQSETKIDPLDLKELTNEMSDEEEDESGFKPGHEIVSQKATYTVVRLLGEGGFGAVYLCKTNKGTQCAMKVEMKMEKSKHSKLEMENEILKLVGNSKHFTKILDRGKREKEGFFFLAMELVGKSLVDLKAERTEKVFSFGTGLGVASQCLEAVEELHKHGFIHRDLKPANYACGLDDNKHTIYILDFGIARKYTNAKKEIKTPRETVGFRGTIRFASLSCHRNIEMGPKDDCESWFYLLLDLILVGGLPWKKLKERNEVLLAKEECRKEKRQTLYTGLKNSVVLNIILIYIDSQAHQDRVNYQFIYETLKEICVLAGHDIDAPYDWEISKNSLKVKPSPEEEKTQKNGSTIEGDMCREIEGKKTSRYEFYGILQSFMTTNVEQSQKMNYLMDQIKTKRDAKAHSAQVPPKNLNLFVEMLLWGVEESIRHCWNEQKLVDFNVRNLCDSVTDVLEALDIDVDDVKYKFLFSRNRIEDKKKKFLQEPIQNTLAFAIENL